MGNISNADVVSTPEVHAGVCPWPLLGQTNWGDDRSCTSQSAPALNKKHLRPQQGRAGKGISSKKTHPGGPTKLLHATSGHTLGNVLMLLGYPTSSAEGLQDATAPVLLKTPRAPGWYRV